ncbi:MAG TPA: hypothetical protein VLH84_01040 [Patescibacteria group bacterium]|nr:hypothetical protein [Patescibacteria group bacterium]
MAQCYFELRRPGARGDGSIVADMMRHLHTRQYLGCALVFCAQSQATLSNARKQWLKLSRVVQKQRAQTLNADKIVKYTHTIAHMQHMVFSARPPLEEPGAEVYFAVPGSTVVPLKCWSVYVLEPLQADQIDSLLAQLPGNALVVDYCHMPGWEQAGVLPKTELEAHVTSQWQRVDQFLRGSGIDCAQLTPGGNPNAENMDNALDTLLGESEPFLQLADQFQRALELARPLKINRQLRSEYDSFALLAHRVQALSPIAFSQRFLETYNEDDSFLAYEQAGDLRQVGLETAAQAIARHTAAGRLVLARAIRLRAQQRLHDVY